MNSRRYMPALLLLFVGSGCAALIYEIVWFQLLQLVIGSSAISLGVLLGTFMGGMCLGSLLPPTLLMGATLPAISRWVKSTPDGMAWLGFFYGGNIAGGVLGCLVAGFYLLRVHDMAVATYVAVALNLLVGGIAIALAGRTTYEKAVEEKGRI